MYVITVNVHYMKSSAVKWLFNTVWGKELFTLVEGSSSEHMLIVILHGGKA